MQSFKLLLTVGILGAIAAGVFAYANGVITPSFAPQVVAVAETPAGISESSTLPAAAAPVAETSAEAKPKREYLGYAWPYADRDVKTELGEGPIVLEEFTTQGCIFCPVADKFFNDLLANAPGIIGLACHVTYLNVNEGNLSTQSCTDRQYAYAKTIPGGAVFTPQMVVSGRKQAFGFEYEKVYTMLKDALKNRPALIGITKVEDGKYTFALPEVKLADDEKAELEIFQVLPPTERSIHDGPNLNMDMTYMRAVAAITTVETSGKAQTVEQAIDPEENVETIVVMIRANGRILAVGEAKL